jgi:hypothetical protein
MTSLRMVLAIVPPPRLTAMEKGGCLCSASIHSTGTASNRSLNCLIIRQSVCFRVLLASLYSYQTSDPTSLFSRALHHECSVHHHLECRRLEPGLNQALDDQPRGVRATYRDKCSINIRLINKDSHDMRKSCLGCTRYGDRASSMLAV